MDVDDQRARPREAARIGAVEEARDRLAIEAAHLDQLGLDIGVRVEPPVSLCVQRVTASVRGSIE
jgi:hypothetical protein